MPNISTVIYIFATYLPILLKSYFFPFIRQWTRYFLCKQVNLFEFLFSVQYGISISTINTRIFWLDIVLETYALESFGEKNIDKSPAQLRFLMAGLLLLE